MIPPDKGGRSGIKLHAERALGVVTHSGWGGGGSVWFGSFASGHRPQRQPTFFHFIHSGQHLPHSDHSSPRPRTNRPHRLPHCAQRHILCARRSHPALPAAAQDYHQSIPPAPRDRDLTWVRHRRTSEPRHRRARSIKLLIASPFKCAHHHQASLDQHDTTPPPDAPRTAISPREWCGI